MSAEIIYSEPEPEPAESETIRRMREALEEGASWVISYATADIEHYGYHGDKPYAYYRVGRVALKLVE